ncbi:MAG: hypothetical protein ACJ71T_05735 [Actinomycetales bacterium]
MPETARPVDDTAGSPRPSSGRHRVADRQFTVQLLSEHWFIGVPGAAQRISDPATLDSWLAANGGLDRRDLDFAGDQALEQRFWAEMGPA